MGSDLLPRCRFMMHRHILLPNTKKILNLNDESTRGMLRDRPNYQQQGFVPSPSSPTSSTTSQCRVIRRGIKTKSTQKDWLCCCYCSSTSSSFLTSLGIFILVLAYVVLGAFIFTALEGSFGSAKIMESNEKTSSKTENVVKKPKMIAYEEIRLQTVEKLWSITEDLNILYKENWTRLATQEVLKFQESLVKSFKNNGAEIAVKSNNLAESSEVYYNNHRHHWSFASSFLYSLTIITTIGYGSVTPRSPWGKVTTIFYAIVGIPLMLIYLSMIGEILSRHFRTLYAKVFCIKSRSQKIDKKNKPKKNKFDTPFLNATYGPKHKSIADGKIPLTTDSSDEMIKSRGGTYDGATNSCPLKHVCPHHVPIIRVPISFCVAIILLYMSGGAYLFHYLENWTYLEGSLFCFASLSTIGFGDLTPGLQYDVYSPKKSSESGEIISVAVSSSYILTGMAMIAMCFNLIQEQAVETLKKVTKFLGVIGQSNEGKDELEGISMSFVSSNAS